jgi:hypothetical protein
MSQPDVQKQISMLGKEIRRKQTALERLEMAREAELAAVREKEDAEDVREFQQTKCVPQRLKQAIKEALGVRISDVKVDGGDPAAVFRQGDYEYLVLARIVKSEDSPDAASFVSYEIVKRNRDSRIWHDSKCYAYANADEIVPTLKKFMRHTVETETEKLSRLYPKDDPRRKACEQLRRMNVLPLGVYPTFDMGSVRYHDANGEEIRLSLAKGKVRWGGWIKKENGEKITYVDVTDKNAQRVMRSFFKKSKQA